MLRVQGAAQHGVPAVMRLALPLLLLAVTADASGGPQCTAVGRGRGCGSGGTTVNGAAVTPAQVTTSTVLADAGYFDTLNVRRETVAIANETTTNVTGLDAGTVLTDKLNVVTAMTFNGNCTTSTTAGPTLNFAGGCNLAPQGIVAAQNVQAGSYLYAATDLYVGGNRIIDNAPPTVSSGFGTSPSIAGETSVSFRVNVGTGGTASSGVILFPDTATTCWNCRCDDLGAAVSVTETRQSACSTTTATITNVNSTTGVAAAWSASELVYCLCGRL